ncbi:MAG TPA: hypothetical protein VF382_07345 [Actinomycetota bacterium]
MLVPLWALLALVFLAGMGFCAFLFLVFGVSRKRIRDEVANDLVGLLALVKQQAPPEVVKE